MCFRVKLLLGIVLFLRTISVFAMEDELEFARASLSPFKINHFAEHIAAPFENDYNVGYGPKNNGQNILNFKPVVPFRMTSSYDLIIRTIAPLYERTPTNNAQNIIDGHYINGWGDMNPTFFISPAGFQNLIWGVGPTVYIPTASNNVYIGSGKWSVGPEFAAIVMPGPWIFSILMNNVWSIAGDANRPAVNQFFFQYQIAYTFNKGWFISTNPSITANWKSRGDQQWLVPFGIGGGKSIKWGGQPVTLSVHAYYNVIRPSGVGPNWQLQLEAEWLFPPLTI